MPIADTLLRLAEEPAFYLPKWSEQILDEVHRTLITKLHRTPEQANRRIAFMRSHFEEALVTGYESLVSAMTNHSKDRQVAAAAVCASADAIVTSNLKDFPKESIEQYSIECLSPDEFLKHQFHLDPSQILEKIEHQAEAIGRALPALLTSLRVVAPEFADLIGKSL